MQEYYVDTDAQLADLCARLKGSPWLALDTEFMREKTYYAQFCLLQVADEHLVACVDPLAIRNLDPLLDLVYAPGTIKVLHSARQDMEIFYDLRHALPPAIFDTQIAATVLGYGDQVGYGALVQGMMGVDLDKSHTRTDWCQRPLDPKQLRYAADDVRYLALIYCRQRDELQQNGRLAWLADDFAELSDVRKYVNSPSSAWRRVRQAGILKGVQLAVLRTLAAWREELAQSANKPRKWVLSDDVMLELARQMPSSLDRLAKIRGLEPQTLKRFGAEMITLITQGKAAPPEDWPTLERPLRLDARQEALVDTLMAMVRLRGNQNTVSPATLTTRKELEALVAGERDISILHGWRRALVGQDLLALLEGRVILHVNAGSLNISPSVTSGVTG